MDTYKILKWASLICTVVGGIAGVAGTLTSSKKNEIEMQKEVTKCVNNALSK